MPDLSFAKRFVGEQVLRQLMHYVGKNPEQNLGQICFLVRRFALKEHHQSHAVKILDAYENNPVIRAYINDLFENTHQNVKDRLVFNWFVNAMIFGIPKQEQIGRELGVHIPNFILLDPTSACNLQCKGCWAGKYKKSDTLEFETLDRILTEAKRLGIYWVVMSGGEPLIYPRLMELCEKHHDMAFMAYTNGTMINEKMADRIVEVGNFTPAISIEGWREATDNRRGEGVFDKIMRAMDLLRERGAIFGCSITITRHNVYEVTSDEFIDFLVDKGVRYGWTFHYIPIGRNPDPDLMLLPEQRAYLIDRIRYIRTHKLIQIADFWNDGELTGGCIAGGRKYFHITAAGQVEPCAFVHFSLDNIKEKSLVECLKSPLFTAYQKRQPFNENLLRPCPIIDNPEALRAIVAESGANPTHEGAETVLGGEIGAFLDKRSEEWGKVADEIWWKKHGQTEAAAGNQ